jgi:hypothetical protein
MGLDMYCYTVATKLLTDDQQTDVPVGKITRAGVGFIDKTQDEVEAMTEEAREAYLQERSVADEKAKAEGLINPDFAYWRKFNHLHGWMEQLYLSKGGKQDFNCTNVRLDLANLTMLKMLAENKMLKPTPGFFFGSYEPFDNEDRQEVLDFVTRAQDALLAGMTPFYDCWW